MVKTYVPREAFCQNFTDLSTVQSLIAYSDKKKTGLDIVRRPGNEPELAALCVRGGFGRYLIATKLNGKVASIIKLHVQSCQKCILCSN